MDVLRLVFDGVLHPVQSIPIGPGVLVHNERDCGAEACQMLVGQALHELGLLASGLGCVVAPQLFIALELLERGIPFEQLVVVEEKLLG